MLEELREMRKDTERRLAEAKAVDPYYFYEPSDGSISDAGRALLNKYLKPQDIPSHLDSQLDVHCSTASIIGDFGGNQSGKTTAGAIESFIKCTGELPDSLKLCYPPEKMPKTFPQHVRVVGEDYDNGILKNILPTMKRWVPREFLTDGSWDKSYIAGERTLYLGKKGKLHGTIEFMSAKQDPAAHQGPRKTKIWYDEEPPYDIRQENLMRMTTADRLDELFTMTPTKGLSWVNDDILLKSEDKKGNKIDCFAISTATNRYANMDVLDEILSNISDYDELKMRLLGEFVSLAGLVYGKHYKPRFHRMTPFDLKCNCGGQNSHSSKCNYFIYTVIAGMDPHQVTPTAIVWIAVNNEGFKYIFQGWQEDADVEVVKQEFWRKTEGYRFCWAACDPSCDNEIEALKLNIYKKLVQGFRGIRPLRKAEKYPGSIMAGVDEIKQELKPRKGSYETNDAVPFMRIFDTPELRPLDTSFRTMERQTNSNEHKKGPKDKVEEGRHHLHAALRYPFQFHVRWLPPFEEAPVLEPISSKTGW